MRVWKWLVLLGLTAGGSVASAVAQISVPFHTENALIMVDAELDHKPIRLLLDSGSVRTLISASSAQVNIPLAAMQHTSYSRGLEGQVVEIPATLVLGGRKIHFDGLFANLANLGPTMNVKCDGILGQDILRQFKSVRIDYKKHVVEFEL
jgi:hypothetical protein